MPPPRLACFASKWKYTNRSERVRLGKMLGTGLVQLIRRETCSDFSGTSESRPQLGPRLLQATCAND